MNVLKFKSNIDGIVEYFAKLFCRVDEAEIEKKVKRLRSDLQSKLADRLENSKEEVLLEKKDREMSRLKKAFGIADDFKEGASFNFETEKDKAERAERLAEEEKLQKRRRRD